MKEIIIATKNAGKANEFRSFFKPYGIRAISLLDLDEQIEDVEETGKTFEENAAIKAEVISAYFNKPVVADDSGLVIDALNGKPGIHSARYAGEEKSDEANIDKVLAELKEVPHEKRTAHFITALAVSIPGETTFFKIGTCEGYITDKRYGTEGFGYDPIFKPIGYDETMAEMSAEEKNTISHRRRTMDALRDWLKAF